MAETATTTTPRIQPGSTRRKALPNWVFLFPGIYFGWVLTKGEAISWYRIEEMFYFGSFHMYGIFMSAVVVGALSIWLIRKLGIKTWDGETIEIPKKRFHKGYILGGFIFGLGWALTGACPGPLYAQVGAGFTVVIVTLLSAIAGTWVYAAWRDKLPH
ncbi:MAG: YeeE/YedE family protein [Thermoflavifilum sp.]|nr:YeeE/YedE family protein [Thermoflavifilum sp.]